MLLCGPQQISPLLTGLSTKLSLCNWISTPSDWKRKRVLTTHNALVYLLKIWQTSIDIILTNNQIIWNRIAESDRFPIRRTTTFSFFLTPSVWIDSYAETFTSIMWFPRVMGIITYGTAMLESLSTFTMVLYLPFLLAELQTSSVFHELHTHLVKTGEWDSNCIDV